MIDKVIILSKTEMKNNHVCVGGLTFSGKYVRLLDSMGSNQRADTVFEIRQAYEIEFEHRQGCTPPHIEDILVKSHKCLGTLKNELSVKDIIDNMKIQIWQGHPDNIFDSLVRWTSSGSGYISQEVGTPKQSVGFWISDKDLIRSENNGIRYKYPSDDCRIIKFKGMNNSVDIIPKGTLLRVSLARWWDTKGTTEERCYLQLSGWYDLPEEDDLPF